MTTNEGRLGAAAVKTAINRSSCPFLSTAILVSLLAALQVYLLNSVWRNIQWAFPVPAIELRSGRNADRPAMPSGDGIFRRCDPRDSLSRIYLHLTRFHTFFFTSTQCLFLLLHSTYKLCGVEERSGEKAADVEMERREKRKWKKMSHQGRV